MDMDVQVTDNKKKKAKKAKLSNSTVALLLYLAGVAILALSLGYIRPTLVDRNTELVAINDDLQAQVARVNELVANQASYIEQSAAFDAETSEILDRFPPLVKEEDAIVYAREIEDTYDRRVNISLMGINTPTLVYASGAAAAADGTVVESTDTSDTATDDAAATSGSYSYDVGILEESDVVVPSYTLYSLPVSCDFSSNYTDLKSMIEKIQSEPEARNIYSMSLSYDGGDEWIVGTIDMNMYYLDGTDKVYESPDTGITVRGKDNVYETIESPDYDSIKVKSGSKKSRKETDTETEIQTE